MSRIDDFIKENKLGEHVDWDDADVEKIIQFARDLEQQAREREKAVRIVDARPFNTGSYNILIEGVHTFMPVFLDFDGTDWDWEKVKHYDVMVGGDAKSKVWWFPRAK